MCGCGAACGGWDFERRQYLEVGLKTEILKCLKETQDYLSGQELCERFGVSRTAVWKIIRQLGEEGYRIEAVRNRGYRLAESGDVMSFAELKSVMRSKWAGQNLVFLSQVDSTNNEARKLAESGAPNGTLVVAKVQTAGKGRRGRSWTSPPGSGIWMSLILRPEFMPESASMLTLLAAMAVCGGIREITGLESRIKWPNDVVMGAKKVCGILTEMSTEEDCIRHVVVGMGINVNILEFPEEIREKATSLALEAGKTVKRAPVVDAVMRHWEKCYETYLDTLDMRILKNDYNSHLINYGRQVQVLTPLGSYEGIARGINDRGELLVERSGGEVRQVVSGEVSVRGIYGYV